MTKLIRKLFVPSTAKALKGFQKATAQLRRVAEMEDAERGRQEVRARAAQEAAQSAFNRAAEAARIADKLDALLA